MRHYATALRSNNTSQRRAAVKELCRLGPDAPLSALDFLVPLLKDPDEVVRQGATEALLNFSGGGVEAVLQHVYDLLTASDDSARTSIIRMIGRIGPIARTFVPVLIAGLKTKNRIAARITAEALCSIGPEAISALEAAGTDPDLSVRREAAWALMKLGRTAPAVTSNAQPDSEPPLPSVSSPEEVFRAWLSVMDEGMSMLQARKAVEERFSLSEDQVRQIEQEGLEKEWDK